MATMSEKTVNAFGPTLSRRQFVKAGGALVVGFGLVGPKFLKVIAVTGGPANTVYVGTDFGPGGAGHLRLSFAVSPANLDLALERMRECVSDLAVAAGTDGGIHVRS